MFLFYIPLSKPLFSIWVILGVEQNFEWTPREQTLAVISLENCEQLKLAAHPATQLAFLTRGGAKKRKLRFHIFDYLKNIQIQILIGFKDGKLSGHSARNFKQKTP